jgi:ketosteroid isomerase-like protein
MEAIFAFYDPAIVWDQTHYEASELSAVYHGHDGIRRFFGAWLAPFESCRTHPEEFIDAGEAVVVRIRQGGRGKQSGLEVEMPALLAGSPTPRWSDGAHRGLPRPGRGPRSVGLQE